MTEHFEWDLYRSLLAVLDAGSLSGAARQLGLSQPTVGRHIDQLEQALGLSLFTRTQAGLIPTEVAASLRPDAEAMRDLAASLARTARSFKAMRGVVRISASEVVGVEILPPLLAGLQQLHPELELELVLSNQLQDLSRREVDIAVRMTAPTQEVLLATRVGEVGLGMYARSDYLDRRGRPQSWADLEQHALIGFDRETPFVRAARSPYPIWTRDRFALRTDSDLAQLACLRAGAGIGICQVGLAQSDERLERLLPETFSMHLTTWVAMHEGLKHIPRYLEVYRALVQGLREYIASQPA